MSNLVQKCLNWHYSDKSDATIRCDGDGERMGKEDRLAQVLELLAESGYALPPKVIYRNLQLTHDRVTFEERSIKNYMPELAERGLAQRVDPDALSEGRIEPAEPGNAYYMITDAGREWLEAHKS